MNCEAVKEMLWAYIEQETTAEEVVKIEEHLKNCESCREELEQQKKVTEALRGLPEAELPEGYHAELMQKLQAEAAPNVVPFRVKKKKKQPIWRQLSMVAAVAFILVAAGGMNGMLEFRQSQQETVSRMKAADAPATASLTDTADTVVEEEALDTTAETQQDIVFNKQKAATGGANETAVQYDMKAMADETGVDAVMPETANIAAEGYAMTRSLQVTADETAVLLVEDMDAARTAVQAAITAADGYEEAAEAENSILAVIPAEKRDDFVKAAEAIGELEWTLTEKDAADFCIIELQLKTN